MPSRAGQRGWPEEGSGGRNARLFKVPRARVAGKLAHTARDLSSACMNPRIDEARVPATDDRVRTDGGKSTEDRKMPSEEFEKVKRNARFRSKDEPGS